MGKFSSNQATTKEMCFFREGHLRRCSSKPLWKLQGQLEVQKFKVCDEHLAWGIRLCGCPAMVNVHHPVGLKDEDTEVVFDELPDAFVPMV